MAKFDPSAYGPAFASLLTPGRLPPLGPGTPNAGIKAALRTSTISTLFAPQAVCDATMAECCLAGIWLLHDFLDESHAISQGIETATGSYWHGLMHRREPDYSNAKYWFRRVGNHPAFRPLGKAAQELAAEESDHAARFLTGSAWDPFAFIDLCEAAAAGRASCEPLCRKIQQREWEILFDYCYHAAVEPEL